MTFPTRVKQIAKYQFGLQLAEALFDESIDIRTNPSGKIRYVYRSDVHLATLRPTSGRFTLSNEAVTNIPPDVIKSSHLTVQISPEIEEDFKPGMSLFAKHVKSADFAIRPGDEIIVLNSSNHVVCVGRAALSGTEMNTAKTGVAAKTRN